MTFFNIDSNITKYPPKETHVLNVKVNPYEDGRRIHISLEVTPFLERPVIELLISDPEGVDSGSATIVEPPYWKQNITMHIKTSGTPGGKYFLKVKLIYPDEGLHEEKTIKFQIPN